MITKAFACINLNSQERTRSSSGGIYPLLAHEIINQNGVVFAACYNDKLEVVHETIVDEQGLVASQGSKYVCSHLGDTFTELSNYVKSGRRVLFVGTPCQCAGLITFLSEKHISRDKVIVVDFVCHGIPGRRAWDGYKKSMKAVGQELTAINMRDKSSGWSNGNYSWKEAFADGRERITPRREVIYMKGMLSNLYLRPSCFECSFKGVERETDFTLGDYWGIGNHLPDMDDDKGTSLLLVHTEAGLKLFESIRDHIRFADANIKKAIEGNACIVKSTGRNDKRNEFYRRLNDGEDFVALVTDLTNPSFMGRAKRMVKSRLNKLAKSLGGGISNTYTLNTSIEVAA